MATANAEQWEDGVVQSATEAAGLVVQGHALARAENDSMIAIAIQRPRNPKAVLAEAIQELQLAPDEAKTAYYSIPYRERQPDGSHRMVPVEGPSIDAAMALSRLWGNCNVTARLQEEDATGVSVAGIFVDYQTNFRVERPVRVSKVAKRRGGGVYTLDPQRWLAALQAGVSKAQRNASLKGLPKWLVNRYVRHAKTIAAGDPDSKADPKKVDGMLRAFARYEVDLALLEKHVGTPRGEWTGEDLAVLIGIGNAIKDGQMTVAEAFDLQPAAAEPGPAAQPGALTPEAVAAGQATGTDNAKADAPAKAPAAPAAGPVACSHPNVPPSAFAGLGADATITCTTCGEELANPNEDAGGDEPPARASQKQRQKKIGE